MASCRIIQITTSKKITERHLTILSCLRFVDDVRKVSDNVAVMVLELAMRENDFEEFIALLLKELPFVKTFTPIENSFMHVSTNTYLDMRSKLWDCMKDQEPVFDGDPTDINDVNKFGERLIAWRKMAMQLYSLKADDK